MHRIGYYKAKLISKLLRNHEIEIDYYRRGGVRIGQNCLICTNLVSSDSRLLEIGDNTVVSTNVEFVLHDFSISRVIPGKTNLYGKIKIGNNCFIGTRSVIMYGVELADNTIVTAGSIVTKSFRQGNIIIGGNPAHVIGDCKAFGCKYADKATNVGQYIDTVIDSPEMLVEK